MESYQLLECDEIHGNDNVSACDNDFTVATSLEDLEFGFSIAKSTQKVCVGCVSLLADLCVVCDV